MDYPINSRQNSINYQIIFLLSIHTLPSLLLCVFTNTPNKKGLEEYMHTYYLLDNLVQL